MRIILLSMIAVCGVLMISIVVSDPRVVSKLQLSAEYVFYGVEPSDQPGEAASVPLLGLEETEKRTPEVSSAQSTAEYKAQRAAAGYMPRDRIPVRRGGKTGGN